MFELRQRHRQICPCVFLLATFLASAASADISGETSWTLRYDFNSGREGERVAGLGASGGTFYTAEQFFEGGMAAVLHARRGRENWGHWGGTMDFPAELRKGDEIWWRVRTYWPAGMDYSANPRLKFLRVHTSSPGKVNHGYNDIYINRPGSKIPFSFIYEGENKWSDLGGPEDAIVPDTWETYEFYLKLDDRSVDEGGTARVRFWKNGKLLGDITDRRTLKEPDSVSRRAFLFTYWNSSHSTGQIVFEKGGPFLPKELVECERLPETRFRVDGIASNTVFLQDPEKDWRRRVRPFKVLKPGDKLAGLSSGDTAVIAGVLHTHPLMDIKMYVDDILLTCAQPPNRDSHGNPRLEGDPSQAPEADTGDSTEVERHIPTSDDRRYDRNTEYIQDR